MLAITVSIMIITKAVLCPGPSGRTELAFSWELGIGASPHFSNFCLSSFAFLGLSFPIMSPLLGVPVTGAFVATLTSHSP